MGLALGVCEVCGCCSVSFDDSDSDSMPALVTPDAEPGYGQIRMVTWSNMELLSHGVLHTHFLLPPPSELWPNPHDDMASYEAAEDDTSDSEGEVPYSVPPGMVN